MPSTDTCGHIEAGVHRFDPSIQIDISAKDDER